GTTAAAGGGFTGTREVGSGETTFAAGRIGRERACETAPVGAPFSTISDLASADSAASSRTGDNSSDRAGSTPPGAAPKGRSLRSLAGSSAEGLEESETADWKGRSNWLAGSSISM